MVLAVVGVVFFMASKSNKSEVKKFDASLQDQAIATSKNEGRATKMPPLKANTAKTAQLSALRERLADGVKKAEAPAAAKPAQASETKTEESWNPEESGFASQFLVKRDDEPAAAPKAPVAGHQASQALLDEIELPELPKLSSETLPAAAAKSAPEPVKESKPAAQAPVQLASSGQGKAAAPAVAYAEQKTRVLLVDDSKVVRIKTEKLLSSGGFEVLSAVDGIDALSKLEHFNPDVIVTDIEMPNLDGFGLVRNIRNNEQTQEIPIIVMTSHVNLHLDIAATEGINGFLPKPFNEQDLLDQVSFLTES